MKFIEELLKNPYLLRFGSILIATLIIYFGYRAFKMAMNERPLSRGRIILTIAFYSLCAVIMIVVGFRTADLQLENVTLHDQNTQKANYVKTLSNIISDDTSKKELIIDFSKITPGQYGVKDYFDSLGISIKKPLVPASSSIKLVNNIDIYQGNSLLPTVSKNFLYQEGTNNDPASFTLEFNKPIKGISFMIPGLHPVNETGITFPEWGAFALDKDGTVIDSHHEPALGSYQDVSARMYTLSASNGHDITAIRFESDNKHWAAFSSIIIEQMIITR